MTTPELKKAYAYCRSRAYAHYENFPVASWLLPARLRDPVAAIYCFARTADDHADEGDLTPPERLQELAAMDAALDSIMSGKTPDDVTYIALADTIHGHDLPVQLFHDLLTAFRQDVTVKRYANYAEVLDYCRYSANPVGRLLLHLFRTTDANDLICSDAICTALQLINFLQDLHQDYDESGRIYLPADEMEEFGVNETHIAQRISNPAMTRLLDYQVDRTNRLLRRGAPLGLRLKGRQGLELRMIVCGGLSVLKQLKKPRRDLFNRPRLSKWDGIRMMGNAITRTLPT